MTRATCAPSIVQLFQSLIGYSLEKLRKLQYLLWLDRKTSLPIKASSYDKNGGLIEEVLMDDLETNVELPESLFSL